MFFYILLILYLKFDKKRNRKGCDQRKELLFEANGSTGPLNWIMIESSSWPNIVSMRVQMDPKKVLEQCNGNQKSLWHFIASEFRNGMSLDDNIKLVFQCIGMRFSASNQKALFDTFQLGVCCELWVKTTESCHKVCTLIKPIFKKAIVLRFFASSEAELKEKFALRPRKKEYTRLYITPDDLFNCSVKEIKFCNLPNCNKYFFNDNDFEQHTLACQINSSLAKGTKQQLRMKNNKKAKVMKRIMLGQSLTKSMKKKIFT